MEMALPFQRYESRFVIHVELKSLGNPKTTHKIVLFLFRFRLETDDIIWKVSAFVPVEWRVSQIKECKVPYQKRFNQDWGNSHQTAQNISM